MSGVWDGGTSPHPDPPPGGREFFGAIGEFCSLVREELRGQGRQRAAWGTLLLFFLLVIILLPFAIGPEPELLRRLGPGLIWLAAVLMNLLALEALFIGDARDGTLDLMLLSPVPLAQIVAAKMVAHGGVMLVALLVMLGPAALLLGIDWDVMEVVAASLALGVPVLLLLGGVMAAVALAVRRGVTLLTLLLVPFYVPVLIFAVGASDAVTLGASPAPNLLLLAAMTVVAVAVAPFVIAAALRQAQG